MPILAKDILFASKLIFQNHVNYKRDFYWRKFNDPYSIMIAEFMLHRTKADQVEPVYIKFLKKYPDLIKLSTSKENDIKKIIESLGLHWRYKHFIPSAQFIIDNYNGIYPETRTELLKIPGIGDYVAGAILTVCYNKQEYVIDSNIARFINRYFGLKLTGEIRRNSKIVNISKILFKIPKPRLFLFALLDFNSLICKPLNPLCDICILKKNCIYLQER